MRPRWTPEQCAILLAEFSSTPHAILAVKLGRSDTALRSKARALGVRTYIGFCRDCWATARDHDTYPACQNCGRPMRWVRIARGKATSDQPSPQARMEFDATDRSLT